MSCTVEVFSLLGSLCGTIECISFVEAVTRWPSLTSTGSITTFNLNVRCCCSGSPTGSASSESGPFVTEYTNLKGMESSYHLTMTRRNLPRQKLKPRGDSCGRGPILFQKSAFWALDGASMMTGLIQALIYIFWKIKITSRPSELLSDAYNAGS